VAKCLIAFSNNYLWIACFAALLMLAIQLLAVFANHQNAAAFSDLDGLGHRWLFLSRSSYSGSLKMIRYLKQI